MAGRSSLFLPEGIINSRPVNFLSNQDRKEFSIWNGSGPLNITGVDRSLYSLLPIRTTLSFSHSSQKGERGSKRDASDLPIPRSGMMMAVVTRPSGS
ncbi:hypothetical protein AXX17_ATUG04100 (mitochondrion) [Arabidopsis thaliana]|uniref:Uncharacterized protein n=1 Tax=Arabidopsis thaliana TaxID=3702 RepID=A0A178U7M5_ARATH|nr:hypothetical protein AXX17_ATUG04100 [Arabidopsis thaliana]